MIKMKYNMCVSTSATCLSAIELMVSGLQSGWSRALQVNECFKIHERERDCDQQKEAHFKLVMFLLKLDE